MHAVLAAYYGNLPLEKVSSADGANVDVSESLALLNVWDAVKHDARAIDDDHIANDVQVLGGPEAALEKVSAQRDLLEAKDEGELMGRQIAVRALKEKFAHVTRQQATRK